MIMILLFLVGIAPAILLVKLGWSRYPIPDKPESFSSWAGFLSIALGLLLGTVLLAVTILGESGSFLAMILLPSVCALFAESCLYFLTLPVRLFSRQAIPYFRSPASLLLLIPFLLAAVGSLGVKFVFQFVLFGGVLLALGWFVWQRLSRWSAISYGVLLLLLLSAVWATDTGYEFLFLPANLGSIARQLLWLAPGLGVILSFRLFGWTLENEPGFSGRRVFFAGLLIFPIFLLLAWQAATASAWDVATDGLGGIFMLELCFVFAIAASIHQSWSLPRKRSSFLLGFVVLILGIIMGANSFGTFGFDGQWGNVPHARTARRAEMINRAVLRYYEAQGQYPQTLADLTPGYLFYLPPPFIIPHQDWCYEAGQNYYRLGYVDRDYFSTPAFVKVFASAGYPPDTSWACDAEAAKYPAPEGSSFP